MLRCPLPVLDSQQPRPHLSGRLPAQTPPDQCRTASGTSTPAPRAHRHRLYRLPGLLPACYLGEPHSRYGPTGRSAQLPRQCHQNRRLGVDPENRNAIRQRHPRRCCLQRRCSRPDAPTQMPPGYWQSDCLPRAPLQPRDCQQIGAVRGTSPDR